MELRLKTCALSACEAMCCHDGVFLGEGEERRLRALVERTPALRAKLPPEYIVDAVVDDEVVGRKTAVRPHDYRNPQWPAHFPRTRCVFADDAGLCELQKLGLERKAGPWHYKPFTCWMFPLGIDADTGAVVQPEPLAYEGLQPESGDLGFESVTPCGRHDPEGEPWYLTLATELANYDAVRELPDYASIAEADPTLKP